MIHKKMVSKLAMQLRRACEFLRQFRDKDSREELCREFLNSEFFKETKRLAIPVGIPAFIAFCFTEQSVQSAAVIGAVFLYFTEIPSRKAERHSRLWQAIDGAAVAGKPTSYARKQALEELARDRVSLAKLDLHDVDLTWGDFRGANLTGVNFSGTSLIGGDLKGANLYVAVLEGANLTGAKLIGVDLRGAVLHKAEIREADLTGVKNVTPEQIKSAKNWELAKYDPELGQQLGRSSESDSKLSH